MSVKPIQTISTKEKLKIKEGEDTPEFIKNIVDYYIKRASFSLELKIQSIIDKISGTLDDSSYKYVTNPYNEFDSDGKPRKLPARLRNYDIITPVKEALKGELNQRIWDFTAVDKSPNSITKKQEEDKSKIIDGLMEIFVESALMQLQGEGNNPEAQERLQQIIAEKQEELAAEYNGDMGDIRAMEAQMIVEYILSAIDFDDKLRDAFDFWFDVGMCYTYKSTYRKDIIYENVHPADIWWEGGEISFIEDADAVVRRLHWTMSDVIDRLRTIINDTTLKALEKKYANHTINSENMYFNGQDKSTFRSVSHVGYHLTFKTYTKVGILTYVDENGLVMEKEVDEQYKINKELGDIKIDYEWVNEIWECYKIDDYYLGYRPIAEQRHELNNSSKVKQPYNGRIFNKHFKNYDIYSFGKIGLIYQELFNIFHFQFEKIMAKNKDKLMLMPYGLKPKGWTRAKWAYFVDSTGFAWFDETNPKLGAVLNALKSIDMSLGNYAAEMVNFMNQIKQEWWDFIGMNRQRFGDVKASDGKGTTEQAIFRSAIITDEFFRKFEKFVEKELNGLYDISKVAYIDGVIAQYVRSDNQRAIINIDGVKHLSSNYGMFLKNSAIELQKREEAKQILFAAGQNDNSPGDLIETLEKNTLAAMKQVLRKGEAIRRKYEEQKAQAENEAIVKAEELALQRETTKSETVKYVADLKAETDIEVALIGANAKIQTSNSWEPEHLVDTDQATKDFEENLLKQRKMILEERKQKHKEGIDNEKLKLDEKKIKVAQSRKK